MVQRVKRRERHRRQAEDEATQLERDLDNYLKAGATAETLPDWLLSTYQKRLEARGVIPMHNQDGNPSVEFLAWADAMLRR